MDSIELILSNKIIFKIKLLYNNLQLYTLNFLKIYYSFCLSTYLLVVILIRMVNLYANNLIISQHYK